MASRQEDCRRDRDGLAQYVSIDTIVMMTALRFGTGMGRFSRQIGAADIIEWRIGAWPHRQATAPPPLENHGDSDQVIVVWRKA